MTALGYAAPRPRRRRGGGSRGRVQVFEWPVGGGASVVFWLTVLLLATALVFGGASRENALQVMGLELLSLPLIATALWRLYTEGRLRDLAAPLALLAAMFALPLLQLAPIPFDAWRALPGRAELAEGLRLADVAPKALPLSLTPEGTWAGLLALLIPTAIFLGASACSSQQRRLLAGLVVLAAGVSLVLGGLQVAGGPDSILRFYPTTNREAAVGLFANRNHQAILLLLTLPLLAAWIGEVSASRRRSSLLLGAIALSLFGLVLIGVLITRSRAGLVLIVPTVLLSLFLVQRSGGTRGRPELAALGLVTFLAFTAVSLFGLGAALNRFAPDFAEDYRVELWAYVARAAERFSPVGSGLGSFEAVYRSVEPLHLLGPAFVNHAHNEYLEVWMELGWAGVALTVLVLAWIVWRSIQIWAQGGSGGSRLASASGIVALLLVLHSVVDYPMRTPAIASVMALACAVLAGRMQRRSRSLPAECAGG